MKRLGIMGFVLCLVFQAGAQGYIVPNGVVTDLFPGEIDVWNPGTQITGFSFTPSNPTTFVFNEPATIGVRVFLVSPNDPISLQPILSLSYPEFSLQGSYAFNLGTPFFVGLYTGGNIAPPYPPYPPYTYTDPVFGWAELENVNGTIEVVDSAVEYQGGGIFAGTETIIPTPEPGTWALAILGAAGLFAWKRRPHGPAVER
jgi:PEP-CTERM motif